MIMNEIRVGLIGFGTIGKLHTLAYRNLPISMKDPQVAPRLVTLLRSQLAKDADLATASGFEVVTTDPGEFYAQRLDAVDICTPNHLHYSQAQQALAAGVAVFCEKPLAMNYQEALKLADQADSLKAITQVAYSMRYSPAIRMVKGLLEQGLIGNLLNFRAFKYHSSYLDNRRPITWRLKYDQSGGGAFQDLGSHLADLARYLIGSPSRLRAEMRTYISQRPENAGSNILDVVDVDDWAHCLLEFPGGGVGELEVSRMAAGSGELTGLEIHGSKGALTYRSDQPESAFYYDLNQKRWQTSELMPVPAAGERPIALLWPEKKFSQGDMLNRHMATIHDFLLNVSEGKPCLINFQEAAKTQEIVEAAYRSARQGGEWLHLPLQP
jgi:predicted dehydrogenase